MNSGYYTLQIYPKVYQKMFRVKPRVNLGLIFFTVLIQNSDKQWKVLSGCLKNLTSGVIGNIAFPSSSNKIKLISPPSPADEFIWSPPVAKRFLPLEDSQSVLRLSHPSPIELIFG